MTSFPVIRVAWVKLLAFFLLIFDGGFNAQAVDFSVKVFCDVYRFKHLIKESTCNKNPVNPKCTNLMLINR